MNAEKKFLPEDHLLAIYVNHLTDSVFPRMDNRSGRKEPMSESNIIEKLQKPPITGKSGELFELDEQVRRKNKVPNADIYIGNYYESIPGVDGPFASEVADIIYYCFQPNCPKELRSDMVSWLEYLGLPLKTSLEFSIIKYETRLEFGDLKEHKDIENLMLQNYIDEYCPQLKTMWQDPSIG